MRIRADQVREHNEHHAKDHGRQLRQAYPAIEHKKITPESVIEKLRKLQVAVPSWALGAGGTRFGRFPFGGEPRNLEEKIEDSGLIHALTRACGSISLHIPWDVPEDYDAILQRSSELGIQFDAVNSNTFQDQQGQQGSYKFGSLCHVDRDIRQQAIDHNIEVVEIGKKLGSDAITVWLADGSTFPGQMDFTTALDNTRDSLRKIYSTLPENWRMLIEYKPYEPNFYSMVIPDWGTSHALASDCGEKAYTLVDLGHHLPNTNIEQIVATLIYLQKLGGFHFNDSKYGDDDLTVGSIKPYQLFLIFNELISVSTGESHKLPEPAWMIDASHNLKDPLEDLMQSLEAIRIAYARALIVDREALAEARLNSDAVRAQDVLQDAFRTDVRPLVREARLRDHGAFDPVELFRKLEVRKTLVRQRGSSSRATGL